MVSPTLTIIAGPNGAGKTTFAMKNFIDEITEDRFINADQMTYQLRQVKATLTDLEVARQTIMRRDHLLKERRSFLIETTLATLTLKQTIRQAKALGFHLCLYYLWISSPRLCDFRVKDRVSKGGHNIPLEVILRRYSLSLKYFEDYLKIVDRAYIYNADAQPELIAYKEGLQRQIVQENLWNSFMEEVKLYQ
jgi:predicted ABC-type ATPase